MNYKNPMENLYGVCSYKKGDMITRWELSWFDGCGTIGLHSMELDFQIIQISDTNMQECIWEAESVENRIRGNFDEFKALYRSMVDIKENSCYTSIERVGKYKDIVKEIREKFCE